MTLSMKLAIDALKQGSKNELGFIATVFRDNGCLVRVKAGAVYTGVITEVENDGFWMTEDYKQEEHISFADYEEMELLG